MYSVTPADIDLHRRAFVACLMAGEHLDADEDMPCSLHLLTAASAPATSDPAIARAGAHGTVERVSASAGLTSSAVPPQTKNRPRVITPGPAEKRPGMAAEAG